MLFALVSELDRDVGGFTATAKRFAALLATPLVRDDKLIVKPLFRRAFAIRKLGPGGRGEGVAAKYTRLAIHAAVQDRKTGVSTRGGKELRFSTTPHGFRPSAVLECLELVQEVCDSWSVCPWTFQGTGFRSWVLGKKLKYRLHPHRL
jgi:hypothetical protein